MDRMLRLAMSGAKQTLQAQGAVSHNLANVSTAGFRADLEQFRAMPVYGPGHPSRVYALQERPGIDLAPGPVQSTGRELDIAVDHDGGYIAVQAPDGAEAYTRAGDLRISANGLLTTGAGHPVLGNGGPIAVPPSEKLEIGQDGTVSIRPLGQDANALAVVDRIKLVLPDPARLEKGDDGLLRSRDGAPLEPDAAVQVSSGALEGSNVNPVGAMVEMIELSRRYEMQVKLMNTAREDDAAAVQMMRLG